jgi:serpin B
MIRTLCLSLALLAACDQTTSRSFAEPVAKSPDPKPDLPAAAAIIPLANANNTFAFELWKQTKAGNLAMSPASISSALAMTWGGAKGKTADEMKRVLHLDGDADAVRTAWSELATALQAPSRKLTLRIANRMFGEQSYTLDAGFLSNTKAPLEPVDFVNAAEASRAKINAWVEDQTNKRIANLLPAQSITAETRLVLVNAIYYLADWKRPFDRAKTRDAAFSTSRTTSKPVPTMHALGSYRLGKVDGVTLLELPYQGDAAMIVALPDQLDGLAGVEQSLDADKLGAWQAALQPQQVDVALPRFTIDPGEPIELSKILVGLGMKSAFDRTADFTGIASPPNPDDHLYLSSVFHKAFVKVDEKGTEASGTTAVVMATKGGVPRPGIEFFADHPFLFVIVDKPSNLVLFVGRVTDPQN